MKLTFSLVIPVYNVAPYIEKCLKSCLEQQDFNIANYEIIIVDDGSPDDSIKITKKILKNYPNHYVKFITRENGGLSAARNTGLKNATGKYVWFIDSDDWIDNNALYKLNSVLKENKNLEIVTFLHQTVFNKNEVIKTSEESNYFSTGFDFLEKNTFLSAWRCIYDIDFLNKNNFNFKEGMLWEDSEFNLRVYGKSKKHYFYGVPLYFYLRRDNSITTKGLSYKMMNSWFIKIDSIYDYYKEISLQKQQQQIINDHLALTIIAIVSGYNELSNDNKRLFKAKLFKNKKKYFTFFTDSGYLKYLISGILIFNFFSISIYLFSYLMRRAIKQN